MKLDNLYENVTKMSANVSFLYLFFVVVKKKKQ